MQPTIWEARGEILTEPKHNLDMGSSDDGRNIGQWETRYADAKWKIRLEAFFCGFLLLFCPVLILAIWFLRCNQGEDDALFSNFCSNTFCRYAYAWSAGLFGGTVFITKWLYHSVGKGFWNLDRRLWRFLSPFVSASLAVVIIWMIDSELIKIFDSESVKKSQVVLSTSFLVGIFSDNAMAKMSEIATALFGKTKTQ